MLLYLLYKSHNFVTKTVRLSLPLKNYAKKPQNSFFF